MLSPPIAWLPFNEAVREGKIGQPRIFRSAFSQHAQMLAEPRRFGAADRSSYEVIGTKGVLKIDPAYKMVEDIRSEITMEGHTRISTLKKRDPFGPEPLCLSDCVLNDKNPEPDGREGLGDVRVITAILSQPGKENRFLLLRSKNVNRQRSSRKFGARPWKSRSWSTHRRHRDKAS